MEVKWGKVCDFSQGSENELLIQMFVNVCQHPMHSVFVFRLAIERRHGAPNV